MAIAIRDTEWIREANLLPAGAIKQDDIYYREYTPSAFKFTDTTLGGNFALNTPPQFCTNADPVTKRYIDVLNNVSPDLPYDPGMGRWYSDVIDDNAVLIHFRFGLPVYNSLTQFFGNFYNSDASSIARTGQSSGFFNLIGKAIGWAFSIRLLPFIMTGTAWKFFANATNTRFMYLKPMMGLYWKYVSDMANTIASNLEMTAQAGDAFLEFADKMKTQEGGANFEAVTKAVAQQTLLNTSDEINSYAAMLPDIYKSKDGTKLLSGIDIYSVSTRAQRLANAFHKGIRDNAMKSAYDANGSVSAIHRWMTGTGANSATSDLSKALNSSNYKLAEDYMRDYFDRQGRAGGAAAPANTAGNTDPNVNPDAKQQAQTAADAKPKSAPTSGGNTPQYGQTQAQADAAAEVRARSQSNTNTTASYADQYASAMGGGQIPAADPQTQTGTAPADVISAESAAAEAKKATSVSLWESVKDFFTDKGGDDFGAILKGYESDGSGWVTFRINGRPSVSESFGNSSRDSGLGQMINSVSTSAREMRSNFADGNLANIPVAGSVISSIADGVAGLWNGLAPSLMVNGVAALAGNAFVDIQKHWDSSSMSFQNVSVDMELRAPYGNNLSRFQCEIVPMCAALVGCLPLATGAESYTGPFYCEWYCRGRGSSRLSLMKSVNIERAVANAPWSPDGKYRGINLRMDMEDLSTICAMPMNSVYTTTTFLDPTNWPRLLFPQDSTFSDFMANLSSCGLSEMVYKTTKFKRNFRKQVAAFSKVYSASSIINSIFDGNRGQLLTALGKSDRN